MSLAPLGRPKKITWSIKSKTDKRWHTGGTSTVGMIFQQAPEAVRFIKARKKFWGEPPKDLIYEAKVI